MGVSQLAMFDYWRVEVIYNTKQLLTHTVTPTKGPTLYCPDS